MELYVLSKLRQLNRFIALIIGAMLLLCAGVVFIDILLRQLGSSLGGTDEIAGYVMAIATSWGMAYTLLELGHVRIDLLRGRANTIGRVLFDVMSMTVLTGTVVLIAIKAWPVLERSIQNASRANTPLETPLTWVQLPWFAGWVWFAVTSTILTLITLLLAIKGGFSEVEGVIGVVAEDKN